MTKSAMTEGEAPSVMIDARIKDLNDWRGRTLAHVRALIRQAAPEVVEEWKWRGVPVWSDAGIICRPVQLQPGRQHPARHRYP